jgi:hypothetical protein
MGVLDGKVAVIKGMLTKCNVELVVEPVVSLRLSRHLFLVCQMANRQECAVFN